MIAPQPRQHALRQRDSLTATFFQTFQLGQVSTPEQLHQAYRLRHAVCIDEFGLPLPNHDRLQRDEFDPYAKHLLLTQGEVAVACLRLILLPPQLSRLRLPFIAEFSADLDRDLIDPDLLPPGACCEISRLVIAREFRRRPGESYHMSGVIGQIAPENDAQRLFPYLSLSLILAAVATFLATDRSLVFFTGEPRLVRRLAQFGIHFTQASKVRNQEDTTAVFFATRDSLQMDLQQLRPDWRAFYQEVAERSGEHN